MSRSLFAIEGNTQRLDGGAMYGNCPRALWERWSPPDALGRIALACRGLLAVEPDRTVLLETGIGAFFEPKLRQRYGVVEERHCLLESLASVGVPHDQVDVVVLSHLHFDHAGGLLTAWRDGQPPELLFPKARFVVGREAFARARAPHARDRASFVDGLADRLEATGRLELVDGDRSATLGDGYRFRYSEGHTPGLMMTELATADGPLLFASDAIPGAPWVHLPITMGYDRFPERLIDEKETLLADLLDRGGSLFFTHDPDVPHGRLAHDGRRYTIEPAPLPG